MKLTGGVLLVVALAVGLAGCAGSGTPAAAPTSAASVSSSTAPDASASTPAEAAAPAADSAALDEFVGQTKPAMAAMLKQMATTYTDIEVNAVPPSTIEYVYTYTVAMDPTQGAAYFDQMSPTFQAAVSAQVLPAMVEMGIADPHVMYTYLNPDGSKIWSHSFS